MLDILWKISAYWTLYEACRYVIVFVLREEVRRIANTKTTCRRCQWRLFCARTGYFVFSRTRSYSQRIGISAMVLGVLAGNGDTAWFVLQKLLEERKALNVRRKEKSAVPGPRVQH